LVKKDDSVKYTCVMISWALMYRMHYYHGDL